MELWVPVLEREVVVGVTAHVNVSFLVDGDPTRPCVNSRLVGEDGPEQLPLATVVPRGVLRRVEDRAVHVDVSRRVDVTPEMGASLLHCHPRPETLSL